MNIVLLVIGVVAAILGIIIRVLTKDTDYEKDGKHYAHPMIIGGLILLVFSQSFAIIPVTLLWILEKQHWEKNNLKKKH